jgi:hypothetical protein
VSQPDLGHRVVDELDRKELDAIGRSIDQIGFVSQILVTSCSSAVAFSAELPGPRHILVNELELNW